MMLVSAKRMQATKLGRVGKGVGIALIAVVLTACGEKTQELSKGVAGSTVTRDTRAYEGDGSKYALTTFKRGDKTAWETHMKTRMQGQDEYSREK
jgi:hypothetical protein